MADWGVQKGLAQDFGFGQQTADIARRGNEMRAAQQLAEQRTAKEAADLEFATPMNAWDNENVKKYAQGKIKELGEFARSNPDYKYNVDKLRVYNQIKRELTDNQFLNEGKTVDAEEKALRAYMKDPKNAPLLDTPEFKNQLAGYENYVKTGSIDGNTANRKLFAFIPPEELTDTTPLLMKYAQATALNGKDTKWLANGAGSIHQFASDTDKALAAEGAVNDKVLGRHLQREYNDYMSKLPEGEKPLTLKQYTVGKMQPYFKGDEYHNFSYATGSKSGKGSGSEGTTKNYYAELIQNAKKAALVGAKNGIPGVVAADPEGMNQILTGGKGVINTNGMLFESSPGNYVPFKGSMSKNFTTAGTVVKADPITGQVRSSVLIQMPLSDFEASLDNADAIDFPTFGTGWLGNSATVKKGWEDKVKITTNDNGDQVAEFQLWAPLDANNTNTAGGYNHGMGGKAEGVTSDSAPTVIAQKVRNGVTYQQYSDGTIVGSDGSITK